MDIKKILKKSISTSILSKAFSFWVNIYVVSLTAALLSYKDFASFLLLSSIGGWFSILGAGISPLISSTIVKDDNDQKRNAVFNTSFAFLFAGLFLLSCCFFVFYQAGYFSNINELSNHKAVTVTILLFGLTLLFSLGDSIRIGYHQTHILNICFSITSVISIVFFYILKNTNESRLYIIMIALLLPGVIVKCANLLSSLKKLKWSQYWYSFDKSLIVEIIDTSCSFFLVQAAGLLTMQLLLFILSYNNEVELLSEFGILFRFFALSGSFLTMLSVPLWPILMEKIKKNELHFTNVVIKKTQMTFLAYGVFLLILILLGGQYFFYTWTKGKVTFSNYELILIAIRFLVICYAQSQILVLRAFEKYEIMGRLLFIEAIVVLAITMIIIRGDMLSLSLLISIHIIVAMIICFIFNNKINSFLKLNY
ncbi:hypothetical protein [Aeromonas caviae]|uniref:hypothetical protein n=1 Tax=Aeromonas caviae TaxID=648 RepID=UPI00398D426D